MSRKPKRKRRKSGSQFVNILLVSVFFVLSFIIVLSYINKRVMPSVLKIMEFHAVNTATKAINLSVKEVIEDSKITSQDLYIKGMDGGGKLSSLSANTVLINEICRKVSEKTIRNLEAINEEKIVLPIGILSGFDFLATKGPDLFEISLQPLGDCSVVHKSSFTSEGINQVNYQIWLEVETTVSVINPLTKQNIVVKRDIPILNTYISGDIPNAMFYPNMTDMQKID